MFDNVDMVLLDGDNSTLPWQHSVFKVYLCD